ERRAQLEHADLVARLGARGAEANPRPRVDLVFPGDVGVSHAGGILLGAAAQRLSPAVEDAVIDHVRGAGVRIPPGAVGESAQRRALEIVTEDVAAAAADTDGARASGTCRSVAAGPRVARRTAAAGGARPARNTASAEAAAALAGARCRRRQAFRAAAAHRSTARPGSAAAGDRRGPTRPGDAHGSGEAGS